MHKFSTAVRRYSALGSARSGCAEVGVIPGVTFSFLHLYLNRCFLLLFIQFPQQSVSNADPNSAEQDFCQNTTFSETF